MTKKKRHVLGVDLDLLAPPEPKPLKENILGTAAPDPKIEEAVDLMLVRIGNLVKSHILQDKSKDPYQRSKSIDDAKLMLKELRGEVLSMVQDKLVNYSRS